MIEVDDLEPMDFTLATPTTLSSHVRCHDGCSGGVGVDLPRAVAECKARSGGEVPTTRI
jgi:hypothetical protein